MIGRLARFEVSLLVAGLCCASAFAVTAAFAPPPSYAQSAGGKSPFARGCEQMMHKNFSSAISSFTEAIADDSNDVNSYFRRGQSFLCLGNYKEAIVDFDRALSKGAMDYNLYLWKGTANAKLNNVDLAIFNYEKAMRLNPKLVDSFRASESAVAKVSSGAGSAAAAASTAGTPAATAPSSSASTSTSSTSSTSAADSKSDPGGLGARFSAVQAAVNNMMAAQHGATNTAQMSASEVGSSVVPKSKTETMSLGSSESAVDAYKTAARRILENEVGYFRAGTTYSGLLNSSGQPVPLSGFGGQPQSGELVQKGHSSVSATDAKRELKELDLQIVSHPQDATLLFQRARVYMQLGKSNQILDDLNRAIELDATNPNYFLARAFYYHGVKNEDSAEEDIRRAQDADPIVPSDLKFEKPGTQEKSDKSGARRKNSSQDHS